VGHVNRDYMRDPLEGGVGTGPHILLNAAGNDKGFAARIIAGNFLSLPEKWGRRHWRSRLRHPWYDVDVK
jgi:hypothetical protein